MLAGKHLLIPQAPQALVQRGLDAWMLIDKQLFTLDGTTCNKIGASPLCDAAERADTGVSYEAFTNQARRCEMEACFKLTRSWETD